MSLKLRPYQEEAIAAVEEAAKRGCKRQLVVLPTGAGKTIIFANLLRRRGGRAIVLAHREELLDQALRKLRLVAPEISVGVIQGRRNEISAQVLVASVATLARSTQRAAALRGKVETVIVDEAHHVVSASWTGALEALGAFEATGPLLVGFTATPDRADGRGLGWVFDEVVYERTLWEMILAGYLSDLRAFQVRVEVDLDNCETKGGDWADSSLATAMLAGGAPERVAEAYERYASNRKGIVFTPTVAVAEECAAELRLRGIAAEAVWGAMGEDKRTGALKRLKDGTTRVLCTAALLLEGFDEPSVSAVVMARPTKSRALYTQAVGRGLRRYPGKDDCLILDCVGVSTTHELITAASLLGVEEEKEEVTASTVLREGLLGGREGVVGEERPGPSGALAAVEVELFAGRALHWVAVRTGEYVLSAPGLQVRLSPRAGGSWAVILHRGKEPGIEFGKEGYDLEWAQGIAEDLVREAGLERVLAKDAKWRNQPASEKQLALLAGLAIGAPPNCTRGQASDLIAQAQAVRAAKGDQATHKQLALLRRLGVVPKPGLTKKEASRLIEEALERRGRFGR
jgi:ATP-dependent helicase IRC3